ncbi:MAG: Lin0512 family protein [Alphaproteobacteria bacterium]|nr:Lin0512 family protein [Alphaproteobacteria bacterium]
MTLKRMALEIGMGTDVRGGDSTKAASRALRDALWRNSLSIAKALGQDPKDMHVDIRIGVPNPETVDRDAVLSVVPYGTPQLTVVEGGLEMANEDNSDVMLLAHAAVIVRLDID